MYNTIILLKGEAVLTKEEYKKFEKGDTIWGEYDPKELSRWNAEDEEEAKKALKQHKCEYRFGEPQNAYYIEEYALEYCDTDEDGDFIDGSDYDLAKEE